MSSINKVILVGHIGKPPEHKTLDGNVSILTFPLATTTSFKKEGRNIEETQWHNIVFWRELADVAVKLLEKGKLIYIEGKLKTRSYEKEGISRYITEIVVNNFMVLGRHSDFLD